ncbi:MAG: hypothetical protein V1835_01130 [Candidatus Micrarchaeota archaeon]
MPQNKKIIALEGQFTPHGLMHLKNRFFSEPKRPVVHLYGFAAFKDLKPVRTYSLHPGKLDAPYSIFKPHNPYDRTSKGMHYSMGAFLSSVGSKLTPESLGNKLQMILSEQGAKQDPDGSFRAHFADIFLLPEMRGQIPPDLVPGSLIFHIAYMPAKGASRGGYDHLLLVFKNALLKTANKIKAEMETSTRRRVTVLGPEFLKKLK